MVRAPALQAGSRGFESLTAHQVPDLRHPIADALGDLCARTTVSGWTKINALLQPDRSRRNKTRNNPSEAASRGRGRFRLKTASFCRRARFSKNSSRREQKDWVNRKARNLKTCSMRQFSHRERAQFICLIPRRIGILASGSSGLRSRSPFGCSFLNWIAKIGASPLQAGETPMAWAIVLKESTAVNKDSLTGYSTSLVDPRSNISSVYLRNVLKKRRSTALIFTLVSVMIPISGHSERLPVRVYSTADGLPSNQTTCVKRDSRGFLWFCTVEGLSRFDGYTFTNYGVDQGLPDPVGMGGPQGGIDLPGHRCRHQEHAGAEEGAVAPAPGAGCVDAVVLGRAAEQDRSVRGWHRSVRAGV